MKIPGGIFDSDNIKASIKDLEEKAGDPDIWNDRKTAEAVMTELKQLKDKIEPWEDLLHKLNDTRELFDMATAENDESLEPDISQSVSWLEKKYERLRALELLGDEFDANDAFVTIHSGAGGTEACDWVSLLMRMYLRWIEKNEYKSKIIDILEAEGGVKSVTIEVEGEYATGYLKGETGIHRLVRISPFDSNSRRHTSFASVYVSPVISDEIDVDIKPDEIRIDTYRAQGAGGQHVNKTDSAVRITHLGTNIVVQCQNERSQHKNKATAMKVLKSKLYEYYKEQQEKEQEKNAQAKADISWGHQIRSYVFHPYSMIKDHRTNVEIGNVGSVMDGDIDKFIEAFLKYNYAKTE